MQNLSLDIYRCEHFDGALYTPMNLRTQTLISTCRLQLLQPAQQTQIILEKRFSWIQLLRNEAES